MDNQRHKQHWTEDTGKQNKKKQKTKKTQKTKKIKYTFQDEEYIVQLLMLKMVVCKHRKKRSFYATVKVSKL